MNEKKLSGVVMRITVVLLCLVLFSSHLASGMFARYTVSASDEGAARAAKYGVKVLSVTDGDPMASDLYGNVEYQFRVDNSRSEVTIKYQKIQISFADCYVNGTKTSDVEDMYRDVKLNGLAFDSYYTDDSDNVVYVFNVDGTVQPGNTSDVFTLTFNTYPSRTETKDDSLGKTEIKVDDSRKYPIGIFVDAEQIN